MDWHRTAAVLATVSLVVIGLLGIFTAPAGALITITVSNNADSGVGSVRQAFVDASTTDNTDDVLIVIPASVGNIALTTGQLLYFGTHNLTVQGSGNTITQTDGVDRVMADVANGTAFSVSGLTLTGGHGGDLGEGVAGQGTGSSLTLTNMTITNNTTTQSGGGVFSSGPLTVTSSTISSNTSSVGGGIFEGASATVTVTNSTISGNTVTAASNGGGISASATVLVTNSTISGNTVAAGGAGGGISTGSGVTLTYATVTGNTSSMAANVNAASLTSFGSVVAAPLGGGANCVIATTPTSHGFNDEDDVGASCGFATGTGDLAPGTAPGLGSLANNGGPTLTELPQTGSPLINAVPVADCGAGVGIATDQRGVTRPQGPGCDIGAVEVQVVVPSAPTITAAFTG